MKRDSFNFFRNFFEAGLSLPKKEQADFYNAIFNLALNDIDTELPRRANGIFVAIKPIILKNNAQFRNSVKGGRKPNSNPTLTQPQTQVEPNPFYIKEKEKEKKKENNIIFPYREIVGAWNEIFKNEGSITKVMELTDNRKKAIKARADELVKVIPDTDIVVIFTDIFNKILRSDFLCGRLPKNEEHKNWKVSIDWVMKPTNLTNIREGKFDNKPVGTVTELPVPDYAGFKVTKH